MLTFASTGSTGLRITGVNRPITVYADKPAQAGDLLVQSSPEENPSADVVSWPGEYDIAGVTLRGIGHDEGKVTSFMIVADGVRCAFPSTPLREWTDAEIEQLGNVDVLAIPGSDPKLVQTLVDELDPRVLLLLPEGKDGVSAEILKACGALDKEHVTEFKLKGLPQEGREVVVFGK